MTLASAPSAQEPVSAETRRMPSISGLRSLFRDRPVIPLIGVLVILVGYHSPVPPKLQEKSA